jgi:hypothetical protein
VVVLSSSSEDEGDGDDDDHDEANASASASSSSSCSKTDSKKEKTTKQQAAAAAAAPVPVREHPLFSAGSLPASAFGRSASSKRASAAKGPKGHIVSYRTMTLHCSARLGRRTGDSKERVPFLHTVNCPYDWRVTTVDHGAVRPSADVQAAAVAQHSVMFSATMELNERRNETKQ